VKRNDGEDEALEVLEEVVEHGQALRVLAVLHIQKGAKF